MTHPGLVASFTEMPLPPARGELSADVIARLRGRGPEVAVAQVDSALDRIGSVLDDEDCQLTLTLLYELHLRGIADVADRLQWAPDLLAIRSILEDKMWAEVTSLLRGDSVDGASDATARATTHIENQADPASATVEHLWRMTTDDDGPGLSSRIRDDATLSELREVLIHRSLYQLREADVHTLGIPRLAGRPKAALIEVQADEYGGGQLSHMHSVLFAQTMIAADLSAGYMHYLPRVPAVTLASLNVLSYFGLHRNRLGELIGHLAAIEMTSSAPAKRYSAGLARLGLDADARKFYDEHIEADAVHEQIVARDLVAAWVGDSAARSRQILDGAAAFLLLEQGIGDHVLSSWTAGQSSLLPELS
ncbi:iron-containing redox enzyme family protein [Gordonia sp. CPCC 205333]|uniref:iron-containing redox enzyme family protein n=1 Tax=Gordonia sp. CPCC 205333 TaxID=3140790 RepID=UPI003AF3FF89